MTLNNKGASVDRITICIGDRELVEIIKNIVKSDVEEQLIKDTISKYIHTLQYRTFKKRYEKDTLLIYSGDLRNLRFIPKKIFDRFDKSLEDDFIIQKFLKTKIGLLEQGRKKIYDGINTSGYRSNIFFEFDAYKYKEYSQKNDVLVFMLYSIKIILFLDLLHAFSDMHRKDIFSVRDLINEISNKIDNSVVTAVEFTDTLKSSKFLYEDYFYELIQLKLPNPTSTVVKNYNLQNITFVMNKIKDYPTSETPEEKEQKILEKAYSSKVKYDKLYAEFVAEEVELSIETGAAADCEIDNPYEFITGGSDDLTLEDFIEDEFSRNEKALKKREKVAANVAFKKDTEVNDNKGIKLYIKLYGIPNVNEFLYPEKFSEWDYDNSQKKKIHTAEILKLLSKDTQNILDSYMYNFLMNLKGKKTNFADVLKSSFSTETKFIQDYILKEDREKKQENVIPKSILVVLMAHNKKLIPIILKNFKVNQQNELKRLTRVLRDKISNAGRSDKAISLLFQYFEGKVYAE